VRRISKNEDALVIIIRPGHFVLTPRQGVKTNHFLLLILIAFLWHGRVPAQRAVDTNSVSKHELVELIRLDSTIMTDIRYATENNFMKRPMYTQARAFLERPAAEALVRVNKALHAQGYGLLVFDGYRPWSITKKFWDETPPDKRAFVADPKHGSKHNRGCAVDLSLYKLRTGKEVEMTSPYDEFSERASPDYTGGTASQRKAREILISAMKAEGYTVNQGEWWHFDYKDWEKYPIMDVKFEEIEGK
jgi:D-alanyl-D-alanine dipeptidase